SFLFTATAPSDSSLLSLHDALPICSGATERGDAGCGQSAAHITVRPRDRRQTARRGVLAHRLHLTEDMDAFARYALFGCVLANRDRKSTRLNSSHVKISYAVFCLKK